VGGGWRTHGAPPGTRRCWSRAVAIGLQIARPRPAQLYWLVIPTFCITCAAFSPGRRTCLEMNRLAKVAERERIARDLHDVLGHTLSLIALKTELAPAAFEETATPSGRASEMPTSENISRQALVKCSRPSSRSRGNARRGARAGELHLAHGRIG